MAQADEGEDGNRREPGAVSLEEADGGAGVWDCEGGDGISAFFASGSEQGGGRVGLGDAGLQLQAIAPLEDGVNR